VPQRLKNVRFSSGQPLEDAKVQQAIADGASSLNGSGRVLVRVSGTEPLIRVMAEGDDDRQVAKVVDTIVAAVKAATAA
jgi:phosphoglucosamine mutase